MDFSAYWTWLAVLRQCFSSGTGADSHTPYKARPSQNLLKITTYDHVYQIFITSCRWFRRGVLCDWGFTWSNADVSSVYKVKWHSFFLAIVCLVEFNIIFHSERPYKTTHKPCWCIIEEGHSKSISILCPVRFIWGQFYKRYLSHQSLTSSWKLLIQKFHS